MDIRSTTKVGIERYDHGTLTYASTRVWTWGISFLGGWYWYNQDDYISSTADYSGGGFQ